MTMPACSEKKSESKIKFKNLKNVSFLDYIQISPSIRNKPIKTFIFSRMNYGHQKNRIRYKNVFKIIYIYIYIYKHLNLYVLGWCSGYHVSLTWRRSPVQSWVRVYICFFKKTNFVFIFKKIKLKIIGGDRMTFLLEYAYCYYLFFLKKFFHFLIFLFLSFLIGRTFFFKT